MFDDARASEVRSRPVRIATRMVAFTLFAAAAVFTWHAFDAGEPRRRVGSDAAADPWVSLPVGWTELPPPPEMRDGAALVWTGEELLAWGGVRSGDVEYEPTADGFSLDPASMSWSAITPAPVPARWSRAVWTGGEAIFFGVGANEDAWEGIAFDPARETWRTIAPIPLRPRWGGTVVWTGAEMIVWGGGQPDHPTNREGAAYDPATDTWRSIAAAPVGLNLASGVWTGHEMIVFGSLLDNRNHAATETSVGAAYDPSTDSWRDLPPSRLSPQATAAAWLGDRMIAYDYEVYSQEYDPATDSWSEPVKMPMEFSECYPDAAVTAEVFFAFFCGQAATVDIGGSGWIPETGGLLQPMLEAHGRPYELYRFASIVSAGDVLLFAAEGITVDDAAVPCYGCPGSPRAFWAWRAPAATTEAADGPEASQSS